MASEFQMPAVATTPWVVRFFIGAVKSEKSGADDAYVMMHARPDAAAVVRM